MVIHTGYKNYDTYKDVIENRPSNCAWWESRYGKNDGTDTSAKYPCHDGVDLCQFTSKGSRSGISGNCDLNRLTGTKAESWFTGTDNTSLTVAGKIGPATVKRVQAVLSTTQDGKIDGQKSKYKTYWPSIQNTM